MKLKKKVLTIGGATQDLFLHFEDAKTALVNNISFLILEEGSKIDVQTINRYTGGGSTNAATSFKRLGLDTTCFFKINKDFQGKYILSELKKERLKTKVAYSKKFPTATSFVLPTSKDRIILAFRGANSDLQEKDIPIQLIKKSSLIYISSLSDASSKLLLPITELAKQNNILVATNPGISQLIDKKATEFIKSIKNIDILILNAQEAQTLMLTLLKQGKNNLIPNSLSRNTHFVPKLLKSFATYQNKSLTVKDYFEMIHGYGISTVVVTDGAEGVYVSHESSIYFHESIPPKKIANTLGAGDAFGSCFVASLLNGKKIEEALTYGIINASSVISHEGAKSGLLHWKELENQAKKIKSNINIIKFN